MQILQDHHFFQSNVATIPVNLEYNAWFEIINPTAAAENEPISLYEHLIHKLQFWYSAK